nr:response regulator transcription factor [uncultured Psychroserpens sp.]
MKILVVDDEALARKRIISLLNEVGIIDDISEATSGKEAILEIDKINPSLLFLDIQMTDMTGFDVLRNIDYRKIPIIIFVTAYDVFAVKAFELQAFDFLLKPFKRERFFDTLERAKSKIKLQEQNSFKTRIAELLKFVENESPSAFASSKNYLNQIVLKANNKYSFINTTEIKYITSAAYYAEIYLLNQDKHLYRISSMTDLFSKLNPQEFARVNRSTIIKLSQIKNVISEGMGDYSIIMKDTNSFTLSKKYRNDFLKTMSIKN